MKDLKQFAIAAAIVLALVIYLSIPATLPEVSLASTTAGAVDPCAGKKQCVLTYVAPWCPVCHASIPFLQALRTFIEFNYPRAGLKIIVGNAIRPDCEKMAAEIGGTVSLDDKSAFKSAVGFSSVPSWWVVDSERKVLRQFAGGLAESDAQTVAAFAEGRLGLSK